MANFLMLFVGINVKVPAQPVVQFMLAVVVINKINRTFLAGSETDIGRQYPKVTEFRIEEFAIIFETGDPAEFPVIILQSGLAENPVGVVFCVSLLPPA